jgi:GNAT superfamily N-acetyltransferase
MGTVQVIDSLSLPSGVRIHRAVTSSDFQQFWSVSEAAYVGKAFSDDLVSLFLNPRGMEDAHIFAVIAYDRNEPAGAALSLRTGTVAGVYWVGVSPRHRRKGVGRLAPQRSLRLLSTLVPLWSYFKRHRSVFQYTRV